ncbi:class I SAM-dependent DNA methyltransferase [Leeuwenhoekiella aequorea]|uniref:class I SAM-dependent DNA methyltransferase n=1 Tax=Leeuwenhoekiella aequorea TaxID=283736 RepID=UPI000855BDA2|nr:type I restriction-modification system, DNA-methyltransferase subunit M [uncultured bacterium]|tara:strand:- start:4606 stop:6207 length:1602 start_codon:yes stop_codon:yes gene_type:complete
MLSKEIQNKVQNLWDRLWSAGFANPISAIEQISYLLFMKRLENFNSSVDDKYKWSNYSKLKNDKELVDRIKNVFQFIKTELSKEDEPFAQAMSNASFDLDNPNLLRNAIEFIDSIYEDIESEIEDKNQHFHDIQGDVYEHLLKHTSEAGKNGQFRTPRHIIHMMAGLLDPDLDGKILDLASGTGGFLVGAYQYLITKYSKSVEPDDDGLIKGTDGGKLNKSQRKKLEEETFYGFDIDRTMVRIGVMNLMMHGISKPHIVYLDSLSTAYEKWEADQLSVTLDSKDKKSLVNPKLQGQFKYILANPPFTGKIDSPGVSENLDRIYPPVYEDKEETKRKKQTVQSELLFLERMVYMLEEGGRAAVIVPEGVLFNSGKAHKRIREILMTDCNLDGVISMPSGVFQPYTGVKTSILIFTKRKWKNGSDNPQNTEVWFYGMDSDGYTLDSNRKRLKESPLPKVLEHWNNKKQENQSDRKLIHFSIPYEEIKDNGFELNFNLYKDFVYEPQEFEPSEKILKKISELELEINQGLEELRNF